MTHHYKSKKGFTLAEVLITLGIIGIVAAMTMPALIANHQKQAAATAVKKMYSQLNQALKFALNEYGVDMLDNNDVGPNRQKIFMQKYLLPYLNVVGECNQQEDCYGDNTVKYLRGEEVYNSIDYILKMSDGSFIGLTGLGNRGIVFWYDYNGVRNPNTVGKDIFLFYYFPTSVYHNLGRETEGAFEVPNSDAIYAGYYGYAPGSALSRDKILNGNGGGHYGCNKYKYSAYSGSMCSTLILMDGKVAKDYPW